jgi:superfamily II RNA helicase
MWREVPVSDILFDLERDDLLPAIVFRSSRNACDMDVEQSAKNRRLHLPFDQQKNLKAVISSVIAHYEMDRELILSHPHYQAVITIGVGAHHAGQLLMWRLMLEELMSQGLLRILSATGTVAAGVDFPARTAVITAHSRRGADGYVVLSPSEFQQMSGRAGRRGRDTVGFCIIAPSAFCDARVVAPIAKQEAEPLVSSYFPSPSTALNLLRYRNVDDLHYTVARSLAAFVYKKQANRIRKEAEQIFLSLPAETKEVVKGEAVVQLSKEQKRLSKQIKRLNNQAEELEKRQEVMLAKCLQGLDTLGYLDGASLSAKGFWAANLCTNLVIELSEIISEGLLVNSTEEDLVAIIASISGDRHRQYLKNKQSPYLSKEVISKLKEIINRVREQEMPGSVDERAVAPDAAYTAMTWYNCDDWKSFRALLMLVGVAEGDAARLITQTAEHLNQLARLTESHPELAVKAERARRRLLRPPLTEIIIE